MLLASDDVISCSSGWLFLVNLLGIFTMNALARTVEQSIRMHWINE
ncbi:MAG: hypothetical protein ACM3Y8_12340 [Byssovorax cruenta]